MSNRRNLEQLYGASVESFLVRLRRGDNPSVDELVSRHPEFADEIRENLPTLLLLEKAKSDACQSLADDRAVKPDSQPHAMPSRLGDYRIIREIGRGGMGIVYRAEQKSLRRHVAVKALSRTASGDSKFLTRFKNEAKAAASLHHTNIVPVLDVGEEDGVYYFVMQCIEGRGLDQVIRDLRLSRDHPPDDTTSLCGASFTDVETSPPTERATGYWRSVARIGSQAAAALQYAHTNGIIHRDVKPSNLLLDVAGDIWVSDFGLAKTPDQASLTQTGDMLGTLRYVAPESFSGTPDCRGDVFGLGLTLYELCTLRPARPARGQAEIVRQILRSDVPSLQSVNRNVPRDLATVIHKAIDTDARRRYQSAGELSADLERFLHEIPIRARRIGMVERLSRWCRRNPAIAAAAAVVLVSVVTALALIGQSRNEAVAALDDANNARRLAEQRAIEDRRNFQWAKGAVDDYLTAVSDDPRLKSHGMEPLRRRLLETARAFYDEFASKKAVSPALQLDRAKTYRRLASIADEMGDKQDALALLEKGQLILSSAGHQAIDESDRQFELATNLKVSGKTRFKLGDFAGAEALYKDSLSLHRNIAGEPSQDMERTRSLADVLGKLGIVHLKHGDAEQAERMFDEAIGILNRLADSHPDNVENLAELASTESKLSLLYAQTKRYADADAAQQRAIDIRSRLVEQIPDDPKNLEKLAVDYMNAANMYVSSDRGADAQAVMQRSLTLLNSLTEEHPNVEIYQVNLAHAFRSLGRVHFALGRVDEAKQAYGKAIAVRTRLCEKYPGAPIHRRMLAREKAELDVISSKSRENTR